MTHVFVWTFDSIVGVIFLAIVLIIGVVLYVDRVITRWRNKRRSMK